MAKCEKCGETAINLGWNHTTCWDKATIVSGTRGAHPAHLAFLGLSMLAKCVCSTVYHCRRCDRVWRAWFE
jgi:hypothetical protein